MDAASPPLELLPDLPLDEPLDLDLSPAPAAAAAAPQAVSAAGDSEHVGLDFVDPEMFLAPGQESPIVAPSAAPVVVTTPESDYELTLEDPVVDELLSNPPPPTVPPQREMPPAAARVTAPPTPRAPAPKAVAPQPVQPLPFPVPPPAPPRSDASATARVPILKTPSLSAAASKLAAANAASQRSRPSTPASVPNPPPAGGAALATPLRPVAVPAAPAPAAARPIADKPASVASAVPTAKVPPASPPPAAPLPPKPALIVVAESPPAKPVPTLNPAAAQPASDGAPMDQDFIVRNQVVERYLAGRLPVKGATDFERFCKENPTLLDQLGLPERVNAGLRLLEASGKPEPWQESKRPVWQKPHVTFALAGAVIALGIALAVVTGGSVSKTNRIVELTKEVHDRVLDPATSTRDIRLLPSRSGPSGAPAITIGGVGAGAQLADFRIDESRSPYRTFKITIDRVDQGRVSIINNVEKDSNGHLRIALNSSALGPGNYQLTLEGLDWRGEPQPDSWITIGISH